MFEPSLALAAFGTDVSVLGPLLRYAVIGLPLGLLSGLLLGLVANRSDGWGGYGSLRRRAARLGHIAAVMLPLIAGVYALLGRAGGVDPLLAGWAVPLWIAGGWSLVGVLFLTAWRPALRYLLALPATALTSASVLFAMALDVAVA